MKLYPVNAKHFIYTLTDPRTHRVVYVGCTLNPQAREAQHRYASSQTPVGRWMDELAECGVEPLFEVIEVARSFAKARRRERELIAEYRAIGPLLNRSVGPRGKRFKQFVGG